MSLFLQLGAILPPFIFLLGSYLIARKWHIGRHVSICAHGGQSSETLRLFSVMTIVLALWYYAAWLFYIQPGVTIPYFSLLFSVATACILIISIVPARPSNKLAAHVHTIAAATQGVVMVSLAVALAAFSPIVPAAQYGFWAFAVYCIVATPAYIFIPLVRRNAFIVESVGILLFAISTGIVALTI